MLRDSSPDTDMPFMNGLTAIRSIQQSKPELPVIIASGAKSNTEFLQRADPNRLINLGKPYTLEALLTAVARLLKQMPAPPPVATHRT